MTINIKNICTNKTSAFSFEVLEYFNKENKILISFDDDKDLLSDNEKESISSYLTDVNLEQPWGDELLSKKLYFINPVYDYEEEYQIMINKKNKYDRVVNLMMLKLQIETYKIIKALSEKSFELEEDWLAEYLYKDFIENNNVVEIDFYKKLAQTILNVESFDIQNFLIESFRDLPLKSKLLYSLKKILTNVAV